MIEVIKEGDSGRQGNAECPQCGERVLIDKHWGDPPECGKCNQPYRPDLPRTDYRFT